jgi:hypothetical protein
MTVHIDWRWSKGPKNPRLGWDRALYAYFSGTRMFYLGKAETSSVEQRLAAKDHEDHRAKLVRSHDPRILVGRPRAEAGNRVTQPVLRDIEALLIYRLKPAWNKQGIRSSLIRRPGFRVVCEGDWPFSRSAFLNV